MKPSGTRSHHAADERSPQKNRLILAGPRTLRTPRAAQSAVPPCEWQCGEIAEGTSVRLRSRCGWIGWNRPCLPRRGGAGPWAVRRLLSSLQGFHRVRAHGLHVCRGRSCCRPSAVTWSIPILTPRFAALTRCPSIILLNQIPRLQQRRRAANQSRAPCFVAKHLAAEWPFLPAHHHTVSHRVQAHVFPLSRFAFGRAEFVVVETLLPAPGAFDSGQFVIAV